MNEPRPLPPAVETVMSFIVERDGSVSDCVLKMPDLDETKLARAQRACARGQYEPYLDESGQPVRRRFRVSSKVEIEPVD